MQISELGEFRLIERLTSDFPLQNSSTLKTIGDDAAVLNYDARSKVVVTTDMLMEGIHFDLTYTPLRHLGYKSAMVNFSDVYAMNALPKQILVSIAVSAKFDVEDLQEFYEGLKLACHRHGVDLVGGDTTASVTGFGISVTVIGEAINGKPIYRSGAQDTDLICCSGNLGAAYMGLQMMEREKGIYYSQLQQAKTEEAKKAINFQPDFSGREYLLERLLKPEARKDIIEQLRFANIQPTAMIDISDGLSSELLHLCKHSNVGCRIFEERIPLDYQTAIAAEEFNFNVSTCALNGGEDYELLFTVSLTDYNKIEALEDVKIIGYITPKDLGKQLITRDGNEFELKAQGWSSL